MRRRLLIAGSVIALAILGMGGPAGAQPADGTSPLAYGSAGSLGQAGLPWQRSNAYLNQPWGLAGDRDGVWVANSAGRNLVRFGSGAVEDLGRAGDLDALYGEPVRAIADVAVWLHPGGSSPTPTPTRIPGPGPRPTAPPSGSPARTIWFTDPGAHVAVGIPVDPYGRTGAPVVRGEPGVCGADGAHLCGPTGIAVSATGTLYVGDTRNHRVQVFAPDGRIVATIGATGTPGNAPGQLNLPARLALSTDGRLYVADSGNHSVVAYDVSDPARPREAQTYGRSGVAGTGTDAFDTPIGVHVDATFLYVADAGNGRVQVLEWRDGSHWKTLDGDAIDACGHPGGRWDYPSDVAQDQSGNLFVALPHRMLVVGCSGAAWTARADLTRGAADAPYLTKDELYNAPSGVAVAPDGSLGLVEREGNRVARRLADGTTAWLAGRPGLAGAGTGTDLRFDAPTDAVFLLDGRLAVSDGGNGRIVVLDAAGGFSAEWGAGALHRPTGVALLPTGEIAVADAGPAPGDGRVRILGADGRLTGELSGPGGPVRFDHPGDVAVDAAGNWYVSETSAHVVRVLDRAGARVRTLGTPLVPGGDYRHLDGPRGIALDAGGRLLVADTGNDRVQVFLPDGTYATSLAGRRGVGTGGMLEPAGVAAGPNGRVYVADTYNHRVQVFDLAREPWLPAAVNGIGSRGATAVEALVPFGGELYAGLRDPAGASVWRRDRSGAWNPSATGGLGDPRNVGMPGAIVFADRLFVGLENLVETTDPATGGLVESSTGGSVHRTADGAVWESVVTGGFGNPDQSAVGPFAAFRGELLAGTRSIDVVSPPQLWRTATGDRGAWQRVPVEMTAGREWSKNVSVSALAAYTGSLYVGTCAPDGAQVWAGAPGGTWRAVGLLEPGADPRTATPQLGAAAPCVTSLLEYEGHLYAALGMDPRFERRLTRRPVELWRCAKCDGTDWDTAAGLGFGSRDHAGGLTLAAFEEPPFRYLYAFVANQIEGMDAWRAPDGLDWEEVVGDGFGDDNNADPGAAAVAVLGGRLHVGTWNRANGGEIWSTAGTRPDVVPTPPGPTPTPTPRPSPQPPTGRARFVKTDEWPLAPAAPADVLSAPVDMAVAADGEVYILDDAPVRVARLLPGRTWGEPFAGTGSGRDRVTLPGAIAVDDANGVVYVSDLGTERLISYARDGTYGATVLSSAYIVDVAVRPDGTLWVADRLDGGVRRIGPDGATLERFGHYGPGDEDGFVTLVAVAEEPGGRVWVADQDGDRLRAFDRDAVGAWARSRTIDLTAQVFAYNGCTGQRLQALRDGVLLAGRCILEDGRFADALPANHRGSDMYGVDLRTANPAAGQYFALATYDVDRVNPANETYPAVIRYADDGFDIVLDYWLGRQFTANTAADDAVVDPVRVDALPGGDISLVDAQAEDATPPFIRRFAPDGRVIEKLGITSYPSRHYQLALYPNLVVSTGEPGRVMGVGLLTQGRGTRYEVLVYGQSVRRRYCQAGVCNWGMYLEPVWQTTLQNLNLARGAMDYNYAVAFDQTRKQLAILQLWAENPSDAAMPSRVLLYPVDRRGRRTEVELDGTERQALWTDIDAGPGGRIYVLDTLNDRVQALDVDGNKLGVVETPKDAWKVAGGPNGEIFVLTNYGHVVRLAPDGTVLSRFIGLPNDLTPPTALADLAVDAWGRVFTVDNLYDLATVFEPQGTEEDVLQGARCSLSGDKWVAPDEILLGDAAQLELALFGTCGFVEEGADIVIAINASQGRETENLRVARQVFAIVDLDVHRTGIVSFATGGKIEQALTSARSEIVRALYDLTGSRVGGCGANNEAALRTARDVFGDSPSSRRKVIVLIDPGRERPPGDCPWSDDSISRLAGELKAQGVHIVAVNGPSLAATSEVHSDVPVEPRGQGTGRAAIRRAMSRRWPDHLVGSGAMQDALPANIDYVPGSARPPAAWDAATRTLTWPVADLPLGETARFSFSIRPRAEGLWPTNVRAAAQTVDGWGNAQEVVMPVPKIRVYGALPTASPTVTATPTPTPTAEPPAPEPVYLPVALRTEACQPDTRNADVALVIDASGSMSNSTSPGGPSKLDAARDAARDFLAQLKVGRDQAAVVQFNVSATVIVPLTGDIAAAMGGLDRLTQAGGTRIDLALSAGREQLTGPNRAPANNPVLILLTDGQPTGVTADAVRQAADRCHAAGVLVFTIGLGQDVDHQLLQDVASRPEWYYFAPDTADLAAIYDKIAYEIPCKPQWP